MPSWELSENSFEPTDIRKSCSLTHIDGHLQKLSSLIMGAVLCEELPKSSRYIEDSHGIPGFNGQR